MDREQCQDLVKKYPVDSLIQDEEAQTDFLLWLDKTRDMELWVNEWLKTPRGQEFFDLAVSWLLEAQADGPDYDYKEER